MIAMASTKNIGTTQPADWVDLARRAASLEGYAEGSSLSSKLAEGDVCPMQGCSGVLELRDVENCSCHINPPCAQCEENLLCCEQCGWTTGE